MNLTYMSASFQGVRWLFLPAYDATDDNKADIKDNKTYFLPRARNENYNVLIDGINFYDQPINDLIRKTWTRRRDDFTIGCLFKYACFKDNWRLIAVDLSKQKALDAHPRAIQQIVFQEQNLRLYTILEKSKEVVLEF